MNMKYLYSYIATLIPLIILDALWILVLAKDFYASKMGFLFQQPVKMTPIFVFYPLYAVVVALLSVTPALTSSSWSEALWRGALLGLAAYSAYDLTNQATIAGWPLSMTIVDVLWGVVVTALTSVIAFWIISYSK
jgi:uncharacterized membrane protein